ncbi:MAG: DNA repair protein RadC [Gammaproteobacteria bacterium]|nr:DNA repair protein RadC [Gammaproteobacteria bacterium]
MTTTSGWAEPLKPREKLLQRGAETLSDTELLAIFLRTGVAGKGVLQLAQELLSKTGGLRQFLNMPISEIPNHKGLGKAKYAQIQAALELAKRYLEQGLNRDDQLESPQQTKQYLSSKLRDCVNEQFACLFLDNRHRVIQYEVLFYGSISSSSVHPRVIVQRTLHHNAAAVIIAHNHPSGIAEPSNADIHITKVVKQALELIDVRLLDHFIIGDNQITSLAEQRAF